MEAVLDSVSAPVSYVNDEWRNSQDIPHIYSKQSRQRNTSLRQVDIYNARPLVDSGALNLDRQGYVLVEQTSAFTQFHDKQRVLDEYLPEMRELLLYSTGAREAVPFPFFQVRSADPEHFFDAYSLYMHCDYSLASCVSFAQTILKRRRMAEVYPRDRWDYAFYNLWRAVEVPVECDPLVWVDASTVLAQDIIDYRPVKEGTDQGVAAVPLFNTNHRHHYIPNMQPDEVLILKQLDSRQGVAQVCPHTSFVDPTTPADARPRRSIDVRFLCIFDKAGDT